MNTTSSMVLSILIAAGTLVACGSDDSSGGAPTGAAGSSTDATSATTGSTVGAGGSSTGSTGASGSTTDTSSTASTATGSTTSSGAGGSTGTGGSGSGGEAGGTVDAGGSSDASGGGSDSGGASDAPGPTVDGGWPNMVPIFDGMTLNGWDQSSKMIGDSPGLWSVVAGVLHGNGTKRGSLSTKGDYKDFRFIFTLRHTPSTGNDHQPCVLIWGYRPPPNDALGGIQFQPPNGGSWDYRVGKNNSGGALFTHVAHTAMDNKEWTQCEILAHGSRGEARMACCTLGTAARCKGVEVLRFKDPTAGNNGPIGLQVHNAGLHDEYKDLYIEVNPTVDDYLTTH